MDKTIIKAKNETFGSYSQLFEKTMKKSIFKNLITNAKNKGILDEMMADEIIDEIEHLQEYEVAKAWYYWGGQMKKVYLTIEIYYNLGGLKYGSLYD